MAFNDGTCLCARGLPASCHREDIDALFRGYGRVANVHMPLEPSTKSSRGYAFVTMDSGADAQACIAALNGVEFCGCKLVVEVSKRSAPHSKTPGIYRGYGLRREPSLPRRHEGPSATVMRREADIERSPMQPGPLGRRPRSCRRSMGSDSCALAEPLSEPAAATPAASSPPTAEPGGEPTIEPGGEPLIEEDPRCCAEDTPKLSEPSHLDSPRSRIRRLEEANIRAVGKQTADALLLQFQQQGFSDPRAAAQECLRVSTDLLLGKPATVRSIASKDTTSAVQGPMVLLSPDEFKNPSSFLRVYGDPLAAAAQRCGGGQPESHQDGNWRCEQCNNVNYPRRQRCHKCSAVRGASGDAIVLQYCLRVYDMLQKGKVID